MSRTAHPAGGLVRVGVVAGQPQVSLSWEDDKGEVAVWSAFEVQQAVQLVHELVEAINEVDGRRGGSA